MSILPADEAIRRFKENEDRINTFINGLGSYIADDGAEVKTIPQFVLERLDYVYKQAWLTATQYQVFDLVLKDGIIYQCALLHTAGTFATDLAAGKWFIFQGVPSVVSNNVSFTGSVTISDAALSSGQCVGITRSATVASNAPGFGCALFLNGSGQYQEADASDSTLMPCTALALETGTGTKSVLRRGRIKSASWNFTPGELVYVSRSAGGLNHGVFIKQGDISQIVGYAEDAQTIVFEPELHTTEILTDWAPTDLASLYGWYDYTDTSTLFQERVTPTTPSVAGGVVGTWKDKSGAARDLPAESDAVRPILGDNGISFFWKTDGGTVQSKIIQTGLTGMNRDNFGGGAILWLQGAANCPLIDIGSGSKFALVAGAISSTDLPFVRYFFNGSTFSSTALKHTSRRCVITWRNNAASGLEIRVNGAVYTAAAMSSYAFEQIVLGSFSGGSQKPCCWQELVLSSAYPTNDEMDKMEAYLRAKAGAVGNGNLVVVLGDSISLGVGSETGNPWHFRLAQRPNSEWRSYSYDGAFLYIPPVSATTLVGYGAGYTEKILMIYLGTNDINLGSKTGAQTWANLEAYRTTMQAAGWKVIASTLAQFPNHDDQAQIFNANLLGSTAYNGIIDVRSIVSDYTNGTYVTSDQIHLKDAAHSAIAALADAQLAAL